MSASVTTDQHAAALGAAADPGAPAPRGARLGHLAALSRYGVLLTFALVFVGFAIAIPDVFLTGRNMSNIINSAAVPALLAVGLTVPLVIGDFDLSVGSGASLGGALTVVLMASHGWSPVAAVAAALVVAAAVGALNGTIVAVLGASSFIITLAMGSVLTGVEFLLTKQQTIVVGIPQGFTDVGTASVGGVQVPVLITLGVAVVLATVLGQTPFGRYVRAAGANRTAAELLGLPVRRLRVGALMVSAVCAGLAGVFIVSVAGNSFPNAGASQLLPAFAAAFLGSTLLPSRQFSLLGAWASAWLLEMVATGLVELNLDAWTIDVFNGLVLIVAIVAALHGRRSAR
ncbi:L-arabinose transport system permease protein AraH [Baekduia alba]|uniref:ABC transporter permease n=1 Tax=Baekduia alba TaxID=2997333 RepID=UPI002341FD71|nr:ABC transporter permease [Baekduia alba]WCB93409.1 L-arabinose transport system permease protein AraH [Baekduia alba]